MKTNFLKIGYIALAVFFSSCESNDDDPVIDDQEGTYKYLLGLDLPSLDSYPFHTITDVEEGIADIAASQEIPDIPWNIPITGKDGYVYLNSEEKITKYEVGDDGVLVDLGSTQNLGASGGPLFSFLDGDRLLLTSAFARGGSTDGVFSYQIIDVSTMTEESAGTFDIDFEGEGETYLSDGEETSKWVAYISSYIYKEGKVLVPYLLYDTENGWIGPDEAYLAIFDATTMAYEKTISTDKAAGLGYSIVESHGFDESGNLYITNCNSNYWAANEDIPARIVKINAGETEFDETYFFNLSEQLSGNFTGGFVYAGDNKAVVQVFRSDLVTAYADYQGAFVLEYYEVDLVSKAVTKLDIPLSKWPRRALNVLDNGKVGIVANTENDGNAIYIYNPADGSVTKGLEYTGTELISSFVPFY